MKTQANRFVLPFFILLFFVSFHLVAQDSPIQSHQLSVPAGPITTIEFEEPVHDYGVILDGEVVSRVFTFTNTGEEPLILIEAKGSCGCTVPQWPRDPIAPGETASITVEFNSKHKRGMQNKKVTITANTDPAQTFIYMKGKVIAADEDGVDLPNVSVHEAETKINKDCFAIYPNPTAEILKLEVEQNNIGRSGIISIFSQGGQLMARRKIETFENAVEFDVSHYPSGTYVANVQVGEDKPESRCFVVVE